MKHKLLQTTCLLLALLFCIGACPVAIFAEEPDSVPEYYVVFRNQNYAIRNANKMIYSNGEYHLTDIALSSSNDFYVTDLHGVQYYAANGKPMYVEESGTYSYHIKFSPETIYRTEEPPFAATECHITYGFFTPQEYAVTIGDEKTILTYNPYCTEYDLYYLSFIHTDAGTTVRYGEEEHVLPDAGNYRILFTPGKESNGTLFLFDRNGNYGSGEDFCYHIFIEDAPEYYIVFEEEAGAIPVSQEPSCRIGGQDAYALQRYEQNISGEEYRLNGFFTGSRDSILRYTVYEAELTGKFRAIDDDNDEDTAHSKLTVPDAGWYEFCLSVYDRSYRSAISAIGKNFKGYYLSGECNSYNYSKTGSVELNDRYRFQPVDEENENYNTDYEQYLLLFRVSETDLKKGNVEFFITDGTEIYRNGSRYISLNTPGTYRILFSEEHTYSPGKHYRYTLIQEESISDELEISTVDEFLAFAESCSASADASVGLSVYLTRDLDFAGIDFVPVKQFSGQFYGGYHALKNISISCENGNAGVFELLTRSGKIERLQVENLKIDAETSDSCGFVAQNYGLLNKVTVTGAVSGTGSVGSVVGYNGVSELDENSVTPDSNRIVQTAIARNCINLATVTGKTNVGGIAGFNRGELLSCQNEGTVLPRTGPEQDTFTNIGGISGFSSGKISDCTNLANVGMPAYAVYVGGIAGFSTGENLFCRNDGAICGSKYAGGIIGGYGAVSQNNNDQNEYFGGMTYEAILNSFFNRDDETGSVIDGLSHTLLYLQNFGTVQAGSYVGGIIANNLQDILTISCCFSVADLTCITGNYLGGILGCGTAATTVTDCFSSGTLCAQGTKSRYIGGIAGSAGNIKGCMSNAALSGADDIGGIAGYVTGEIFSCYTNVTIICNRDSANVGDIAGYAKAFNPSMNRFDGSFGYNYYTGDTGGIGKCEYGSSYEFAAMCISAEHLRSDGALSPYLNEQFSHFYWQGGNGESFPVLVSMTECRDSNITEDTEALFAQHAERLADEMQKAAQITYSVIFMEWNKDNGELYEDGQIQYQNFEPIWSGRIAAGGTVPAASLKFAENSGNAYVYTGSDRIWFVTLENAEKICGNTVVYASYRPAVSSISTDDQIIFAEGLFDAETVISLIRLGDCCRVEFRLGENVLSYDNYTVKYRLPDPKKTYIVYNVHGDQKIPVESSVSGNYMQFQSDGESFCIEEKPRFALSIPEIILIVFSAVSAIACVILAILLGKKGKRKHTEKAENS